jgi:hypothetical protein
VLLLMLIWEMDAIDGILGEHGRVDLKHGRVSETIAVGKRVLWRPLVHGRL